MDESRDGIEPSITSNSAMSGSGRKRGHQHHVRYSGTRTSTVRADEVIAALRRGDQLPVTQTIQSQLNFTDIDVNLTDSTEINKLLNCDDDDDDDVEPTDGNGMTDQNGNRNINSDNTRTITLIDDLNKNNRLANTILIDSKTEQLNKRNVISRDSGSATTIATDTVGALNSDIDMELTKDELNDSISSNSSSGSRSKKTKRSKKDKQLGTEADGSSSSSGAKKERRSRKTKNLPPAEERPPLEGADAEQWTNENADVENDPEAAEWSKLRCTSERAEVVAEREYRRQNRRCADYPGLAFGRSIFSSDTMMKLNIIRNELHNIMKTQLKRVCVTDANRRNAIAKKIFFLFEIAFCGWWLLLKRGGRGCGRKFSYFFFRMKLISFLSNRFDFTCNEEHQF